eukprot:TRINITY_DN131_c0_g1_i2.p2 TRINITY_DN131_c0_g1~~TRINITY_DN131_c0_g1_i2.p2  ORF type:complete len:267 (+),score=111.52 TRINITY_DN131_c0_g1_i2:54-854(+)
MCIRDRYQRRVRDQIFHSTKMFAVVCFLALAAVASATVDVPVALTDLTITQISGPPQVGSAEECELCVEFMGQALNNLINIIAQVGIGGTCADVCSKLPNGLEAKVCDILCEIAGIEGLVKALSVIDPTPINVCQDITICPKSSTAAANITSLTVSPKSGRQGTTFAVDMVFQVIKKMGTGQIVLEFVPPNGDGQPFGSGNLLVETAPGIYQIKGNLQTMPNKQEPFNPGQFGVVGAVCEGTCGSQGKHPDARLLSQRQTSFSITQ